MSDNLDDILDATLDDLEDLPEFKPFPAGVYRVAVNLDTKDVNKKPGVEMSMKHLETIELVDADAADPKEGDESSMLFFLDNEFGRGKLKNALRPLTEAMGTSTNRETIEQTNDIECMVVLGVRADKDDKDKLYQNLKEMSVI